MKLINDLPPRKTLVLLFQSLQYAQSDLERKEIVRTAQIIRKQLLSSASTCSGAGGLSPLAKRIQLKCGGQTLSSTTIALACGKSPGGGTIKRAIRELILSGFAEKKRAGLYAIFRAELKKIENPD